MISFNTKVEEQQSSGTVDKELVGNVDQIKISFVQ